MAVALARSGVRCVLLERHPSTTDHPKARAVNTRTMELFRLWGIEADLNARALSQDYWRFRWCETMAGRHLGSVANPDGETTIHSPTVRRIVSQDVVEELLFQRASSLPMAELRFSTQLESADQDGDGKVTVWEYRAMRRTGR